MLTQTWPCSFTDLSSWRDLPFIPTKLGYNNIILINTTVKSIDKKGSLFNLRRTFCPGHTQNASKPVPTEKTPFILQKRICTHNSSCSPRLHDHLVGPHFLSREAGYIFCSSQHHIIYYHSLVRSLNSRIPLLSEGSINICSIETSSVVFLPQLGF